VFGEIGVLCCELIMHFRVMMFVSSGLYLTVMTIRGNGRLQLLPITQLRSFEYYHDLSQAMPRIFFATCTC
jgi:hypothetical protein